MKRILFLGCIAVALSGCGHPPSPAPAPIARARFYAQREKEKPAANGPYETLLLHTADGDVIIHLPRIP